MAANKFIRILYTSGVWLCSSDAAEVANYGFRFLRRYSDCALRAFQRNLRHFMIQPKAHAMHHLFLSMLEASSLGPVMSILCTSVQQDEDYIGRASRLSRHVSETHISERVCDRYLQSAYAQWVKIGYIIRAGSWDENFRYPYPKHWNYMSLFILIHPEFLIQCVDTSTLSVGFWRCA